MANLGKLGDLGYQEVMRRLYKTRITCRSESVGGEK